MPNVMFSNLWFWPYVLLTIVLCVMEWVSYRMTQNEDQRSPEQEDTSTREMNPRPTCSAFLTQGTTMRRYFRGQRLGSELGGSFKRDDLIVTDSDIDTALRSTSSLSSLRIELEHRNLSPSNNSINIINDVISEDRSLPNVCRPKSCPPRTISSLHLLSPSVNASEPQQRLPLIVSAVNKFLDWIDDEQDDRNHGHPDATPSTTPGIEEQPGNLMQINDRHEELTSSGDPCCHLPQMESHPVSPPRIISNNLYPGKGSYRNRKQKSVTDLCLYLAKSRTAFNNCNSRKFGRVEPLYK